MSLNRGRDDQVRIAASSFQFDDGDGLTYTIRAGERVASDHPSVARHPAQYRTVEEDRLARAEELRSAAADPRNREAGVSYDRGDVKPRTEGGPFAARLRESRDEALRTVERHADYFRAGSDAAIEHLLRHDDPDARGAEYISAHGDPHYASAFCKIGQFGAMATARMTHEEVDAVQRAAYSERAMSIGTTTAGGFGIPIQIDPTIIMSGTGSLNPYRQVSTVRTMVSDTLRLVSSDGVVAAYAAEGTEAGDNSPTLAQPVVNAARGQVFVPYSWEVGQDYDGLLNELGKLVTDARDVVDATQFTTGNGSDAPVGILAVGTTGSLTTAQRIQTAGVATYAIGDPWLLKAGIPARALGRVTYAANPAIWDTTYRFAGGNSAEPLQFGGGRGGDFLGAPKIEASAIVSTTTTGSKIMVVGDWSGFVIGDRIGLTVSIIPHLFGAANRYPTGQSGLYGYWRTGSIVAAPNLFRYLELK